MKERHLREIEQRAAGERLGPWARLLILSLVAEIRRLREAAEEAPAIRKNRTAERLDALANSIRNNFPPATLAADR